MRDGANLVVEGYDFAPTFSIWTTIEECLNPPVDLGEGPRLVHDRAVLRAGGVRLPGGDRPGRVRERRARGGAARPALGRLQARHVQVRPRRRVHRRAEDAAQARARLEGEDRVRGRRGRAARRRRRGAARPADARRPDDAARPAPARSSPGTGKDGAPRKTYLYHVVDNEWTMREYGSQAVVWQTAINPVDRARAARRAATWKGAGVLGPEAFRRSRSSTSSPSTARRTASSSSTSVRRTVRLRFAGCR